MVPESKLYAFAAITSFLERVVDGAEKKPGVRELADACGISSLRAQITA